MLENDERFGLLASGISFVDGEHLREVGYLAVVTLTPSRNLIEDWLSSPSSSKLSNSCSNFSRRERRF